ncbi:TonB-dependent receptor [Brevundimonas sp. NIBR11]|uniref:TonB-dependent receptor domain-containing protein n=1 Tax=Brevundimonas sp. NIBR11 TaxID=3015999 RepID=UPI0022F085EF|nr:TonB-dependent receptor [Brevundimonas sp. NIBR11]
MTGSRIRRVDPANAPQPLIQVGREEILQSGQPNLVDYLADVPALQGSQVPEDTTGAVLNTGGLALLNLRNLGSNRTLVLVDGRRHVGAPQGQLQVDVDTIPSTLIQNVEIVTGGSAAVYGADAVSGVVNFVMRRDYEGLEIDTSLNQINKNGELNGRISVTAGANLLDDRLNVYGFAEYQENQAVKDADIAWRRRGTILLGVDADLPPGANFDGVLDNVLVGPLNDLRTTRGGIVTLAGQVLPTSNIAVLPCAATTASQNTNTLYGGGNLSQAGNCFAADPGRTFAFDSSGVARAANFGSIRSTAGYHRTLTVGGDGENTLTGLSQVDRIPASNQQRYQAGVNFDLTDSINIFGEAKYVTEENFYRGQPAFFDIGIGNVPANTTPGIFSSSAFNIGLDNAYLDPTVRAAILANTRPVINSAGVVTGTVADQRAVLSLITRDISGDRSQRNERTVERYVAGIRGDADRFLFLNDFNWEISGTYGKVDNYNLEGDSLDVERFQFQIDAVRDTLGRVNGQPGQIVCRVQLLAAQGIAIPDRIRGGTLSPTNPTVTQCTPGRVFGEGGFSDAAKAYSAAEVFTAHTNEQTDAVAFASGNLWDFWGAGPIGIAAGLEYRKEETVGTGRAQSYGDRFLFLNSSADFPAAEYDTKEAFAELRIPLLRDLPGAQLLELAGAYRTSDYSTIGKADTYNVTAVYRPVEDIMFRASVGEAIRVPSLSETFLPPSQTFANGFVDPCDFQQIRNATPEIQANRRANCTALLGAGYNPDSTSIPSSSVSGFNQGNPFLLPEESESFTFSTVLTPRIFPRLSIVLDYYQIEISNVISAVTAQAAANRCVDGGALDPAACATLTRVGAAGSGGTAPFGVSSFIQGSINFAKTNNSGIDFTLKYDTDIADTFIGRDWGNISYSIRGNYLIRQDDFTNIAQPAQQTSFAGSLELPRVRFLQSVTYSPWADLAVTWNMEFQTAQQLVDKQVLLTNNDTRAFSQFFTQDYFQHDVTVRWQVNDELVLRGGVVNLLDREPDVYLGNTSADTFDFYGRRFFIGLNYKY